MKLLNQPSMVYRRRSDVFSGIDQLKQDQFFVVVGETTTRDHPLKLFEPQIRILLNVILCASRAIINDWNTLTTDTILVPTLNILRAGLRMNARIKYGNMNQKIIIAGCHTKYKRKFVVYYKLIKILVLLHIFKILNIVKQY